MNIEYNEFKFDNEKELNEIAEIHANIPHNRNKNFKATLEMIEEVKKEIIECRNKSLDSIFLIAKYEIDIVGFHWLDKRIINGLEIAHIRSLEVQPEYRNKGIGKKLKDLGEEWAKKVNLKIITTKVSYDNKYMIEYNIKRDFRPLKVEMIKEM